MRSLKQLMLEVFARIANMVSDRGHVGPISKLNGTRKNWMPRSNRYRPHQSARECSHRCSSMDRGVDVGQHNTWTGLPRANANPGREFLRTSRGAILRNARYYVRHKKSGQVELRLRGTA